MNINCSQPDDLGIWRFGIISPLLHHDSNEIPLHAQISNLIEKYFVTPDGRQKKLAISDIPKHVFSLFLTDYSTKVKF